MHNFQGLYQSSLYNVHFLLHKCLSLHSYFKAKIEPYALHWPTFFRIHSKKKNTSIQILSLVFSDFRLLSVPVITQNKCVIWHTSVVSSINKEDYQHHVGWTVIFFCLIQTNYRKPFASDFADFQWRGGWRGKKVLEIAILL